MDRRERQDDLSVLFLAALQGFQAGLWTAMPGIVDSFNAADLTAWVQPAIKGRRQAPEGAWSDVTLPLCQCPVVFPGGGGFTLTFPIVKGDEGLIVFASRSIDAWWESGGVQVAPQLRMMDASDGFFLPSVRSKARALADVSETTVQLRSDDGARCIEINETKIKIKGDVEIEGAVTATGNVTAGQGGADMVTLQFHRHPGNNLPPTPGH